MRNWDDARRYDAALQEQTRINDEIADQARAESKKSGNLGFLLFTIAVILFKPFAEYCIDLYKTVAEYAHSLGGVFGF